MVKTTPEVEKPVTLHERLRFAYGGAAPAEIARFFEGKSELAPFDGYSARGGPLPVARRIAQESRDAQLRLHEAQWRLDEIEARLAELRAGYSAACAALNDAPPLTATPREAGLIAVDKAGYERLIPAVEGACRMARAEVARTKAHADNWRTLSELASVIAGQTRPTETLAAKIGNVRFR